MVQAGTRHDFVKTKEYRGPSVPSPLTNNPRAGQWTNAMSHNMIADYKRFLMTDGEGIRCSLYVSGCPFHCEGCYNSSIWDFQAGHEYNEKLEAQIMDDLAQSFVQGITFLGGEPLLNTGVLLPLARKIREIDILVDGRYIKTLHDSLLQFRGSSNQRIIDVPASLEQGDVVIWGKLHDQERFIPEIYGHERAAGEGDAS